jgi:hypothetical protein
MNNSEKEALRWYPQGTRDACRDLDVFYVPTRYPSGIPDGAPFEYFRPQHAEKACRADQPRPPGRELGPHVIG